MNENITVEETVIIVEKKRSSLARKLRIVAGSVAGLIIAGTIILVKASQPTDELEIEIFENPDETPASEA